MNEILSGRCGKVKARGSGNSDKTMESSFSLNLLVFGMFGSLLARKKKGTLYAGSFFLSHTFMSYDYTEAVVFFVGAYTVYRCSKDSNF